MDHFATVWLPLGLAIIMFSLGLGLTGADFGRLVRRPKAFAVGTLAQVIGVPVIAYAVVIGLDLQPDLAMGLMILAFCPGGATSNVLTKYARGDVALSISLTGIINLISIVTVPPLVTAAADHLLGIDVASIDVTTFAISMFNVCAIPVILGIMVRRHAPMLASRIKGSLEILSHAIFAGVVVMTLATNWRAVEDNTASLVPALLLFGTILLSVGFLIARIFRLSREEALAVAIETAVQNTTMGIAVAALVAERAGVSSTIGLASGIYGITMYLVCLPFLFVLRSRARTA